MKVTEEMTLRRLSTAAMATSSILAFSTAGHAQDGSAGIYDSAIEGYESNPSYIDCDPFMGRTVCAEFRLTRRNIEATYERLVLPQPAGPDEISAGLYGSAQEGYADNPRYIDCDRFRDVTICAEFELNASNIEEVHFQLVQAEPSPEPDPLQAGIFETVSEGYETNPNFVDCDRFRGVFVCAVFNLNRRNIEQVYNDVIADQEAAQTPINVTPQHHFQTLVDALTEPHEGRLAGVPDFFDWAFGPRVGFGNTLPEGWNAMIVAGAINQDADRQHLIGDNTRIEVRNLNALILSKSTGEWRYVQQNEAVTGAAFRNDFGGNTNTPADIRNEPDGGVSVRLMPGYNFHFFAPQRVEIDPDDVGGVITFGQVRLILNDPNGEDDRRDDVFLGTVGADYWKSLTAPFDNLRTNGDVVIPQIRHIGNEWEYHYLTTLTETELLRNPPPLDFSDIDF